MGASGSQRGTSDARSRRAAIALLGCLLLAVPLAISSVRAQPPIPMLVHGHAYDVNGVPLAAGTPLRALVDGVVYSNDSQVSDAAGTYSILIAGNWMQGGSVSETPTIKEGADIGDVVTFATGDFTNATLVFQETASWYPAAVASLDLHLGINASQPATMKIQAIVTQPARLNTSYVVVCNAYSAGVSLGGYYLQKDVPGGYDGPRVSLAGNLTPGAEMQVNVTGLGYFDFSGDAVKLVYRNPGGGLAAASGRDIPVDRVEFNATTGGTLDWEPGATIMGSAPAPGPALMLARSPDCSDTNAPRDFVLQREPGLPATSTVSVVLVAPTAGQAIPGGQAFTIRWTLGSNTFTQFAYLRVWVNVSVAGTWTTLVAGIGGVESAAWDVPNVAEPAAVVNVTVVDPFGARDSQAVGMVIQLQSPWPIVLAVLIAAVVGVFLFLGYRSVRRSRAQPPGPAAPAPTPPEAGAATIAGTPAEGPPEARTKVCPKCGTRVKDEDDSCFYCGHLFVQPPPP